MKNHQELIEFLKVKLEESEQERDKWFELSRTDERDFVKGEVNYHRGKINMIRHVLIFLNESE